MSTDQSAPLAADEKPASPQRRDKRGWGGWVAGAALAAFTLFFIANARVALDPRASGRALFAVEGFPTIVVIDPEGYIRAKWEGLNPAIAPAMSNALKTL